MNRKSGPKSPKDQKSKSLKSSEAQKLKSSKAQKPKRQKVQNLLESKSSKVLKSKPWSSTKQQKILTYACGVWMYISSLSLYLQKHIDINTFISIYLCSFELMWFYDFGLLDFWYPHLYRYVSRLNFVIIWNNIFMAGKFKLVNPNICVY